MQPEDVKKVARLARLTLTDDEVAEYATQLTDILDYVRMLEEVDVEGVEPMPHAVELTNVLREDVVRPSLPREEALQNSPGASAEYFEVPRILDQKNS